MYLSHIHLQWKHCALGVEQKFNTMHAFTQIAVIQRQQALISQRCVVDQNGGELHSSTWLILTRTILGDLLWLTILMFDHVDKPGLVSIHALSLFHFLLMVLSIVECVEELVLIDGGGTLHSVIIHLAAIGPPSMVPMWKDSVSHMGHQDPTSGHLLVVCSMELL